MALQFAPDAGTVLVCDYDLGRADIVPAEMTKRRPVVVVSPRRRHFTGTYLVVPLSTQPPLHPDRTHYRLQAGTYYFLSSETDSWAKCEMVGAVSTQRL